MRVPEPVPTPHGAKAQPAPDPRAGSPVRHGRW